MKMTDNEIIKGLKCCITDACDCCPFAADTACLMTMLANVRNLVNRQKEMIDGLIAGQETLQAEIERLKEKNESLDALVRSYGDYVTKTRAEAIKEFAERLKPMHKSLCVDKGDWSYEIDNLVKEMVGEE